MADVQKMNSYQTEFTLNKLSIQIDQWKSQGASVGIITGLFETLHLGNLRLIFFAKESVDYLVIIAKPHSAVGRLEAECKICDLLFECNFDEEQEIIDKLKPTKVFKGDEWYLQEAEQGSTRGNKLVSAEVIFVSDEFQTKKYDQLIFELFSGYKSFFFGEYLKRHKISFEDVQSLIDKLDDVDAFVYGDCILDRFETLRLIGSSREDGLPVYQMESLTEHLGGGFLPAKTITSLGGSCHFLSIYCDPALDAESAAFPKLKILELSSNSPQRIPLKTRYLYNGNRVFRLSSFDSRTAAFLDVESEIVKWVQKKNPGLFLFFDFGLGALTNNISKNLVEKLREKGVVLGGDSQTSSMRGDINKFEGVDILTPTELELRECLADHHSGLKILMEKGFKALNCKHLTVTLGQNGCMIMSNFDNGIGVRPFIDFLPSFASEVSDVSGAGDTYLTVTSMGLANGASIWVSSILGAMAAAVRVEKGTDGPINKQELKSKASAIKSLLLSTNRNW